MKRVTTYEFTDMDIEVLKEAIHNSCNGCESICVDCGKYRRYKMAIAKAEQEGMRDIIKSLEVIDEIKREINRRKRTAQNIFNELPREVQELYLKERQDKNE